MNEKSITEIVREYEFKTQRELKEKDELIIDIQNRLKYLSQEYRELNREYHTLRENFKINLEALKLALEVIRNMPGYDPLDCPAEEIINKILTKTEGR